MENIGADVVKNGQGYSAHRTLKFAVSQKENNGINWFLVCLYKFINTKKSYFNIFLVVVIKTWRSLFRSRDSVVICCKICSFSRMIGGNELIFRMQIQIMKAKSYFNYCLGMVKKWARPLERMTFVCWF